MNAWSANLWAEMLKTRKSRIFPASVVFFVFIGLMMGILVYLSLHPELTGRSDLLEMKTSFLNGSDWNSYFELLLQILLTVGLLGSGMVTSWIFGREFADRTAKDLLAMPFPRYTPILSKFIILFAWTVILCFSMLISGLLTGWLIGLNGWVGADFSAFLKVFLKGTVLNALLITPVAFIALVGRGIMLPISTTILILILTQIIFVGIPSITPYFPWALPALISGVGGEATPAAGPVSYIIFLFTFLSGLLGTILRWKHADQR